MKNLFFGDSITAAWPLTELLPERNIMKFGYPGESVADLIWHIHDDVFANTPCQVFLMGGINGIQEPEEQTAGGLEALASAMLRHGAEVCLQSILPLRFPDRWNRFQYQDRISRINSRLADWAKNHEIPFIDYHAQLRDATGQLAANFANADGTHLKPEAYVLMSQIVTPFLKEQK